jgi:ribosomal-protein-alanine N-acetyltransferase
MLNKIFTPFPTLHTERLTLRQVDLNDEQEIFALRSDEDTNRYIDRDPAKTIDDARNFITRVNENIRKNEAMYWAVAITDSNTFAGTICLFSFSDDHHKCEIGYELLKDFRGQGIMQEAVQRVIDYAFQTIGLQTLEAFSHKENQGSLKLLQKLNFKRSIEPDRESGDYHIFILPGISG